MNPICNHLHLTANVQINGELVLVNEEAFDAPISIVNMFKQYVGQAIDLKLGGAAQNKNLHLYKS